MTVMIGIDPHKRSHTAVALDEHGEFVDQIRVDADPRQIARLLGWAKRWPERVWAVENANGLGWLLSRQLLEAGQQVRDVPAALSAQVRKLSGSGHKTDAHDARSTAIAGRHAQVLREVVPDGVPQLLGLLVERRWHIVSARQKTPSPLRHLPDRHRRDRRVAAATTEGKPRAEATRSLKRHLSNVAYRALLADVAAHDVSGEDIKAA